MQRQLDVQCSFLLVHVDGACRDGACRDGACRDGACRDGAEGRDGLLRREQQEEKRTGDGRSGGRGGGKGRSCNRRSRSNSLAHAMLCWAGPAAYQYSRAHTAAHYYRMSSRRRRRRRRWRHWRLPCYRKLQSGMVRNMARTEQSNRFQCGAVPCDSVHSSSTFCFCQTPAQKQFQCRHR